MNYNKLPYKEKKRQLKYRFEQTEKQEEKLLKKEIKQSEEEKRSIEKKLNDR